MDQNDQCVKGAGDQTGAGATPPGPADPGAAVMRLLAEHVPLTLLADLAAPDGPASQVILETEGLPDEAWWEADPGIEPPDEKRSDEVVLDPEAAHGGGPSWSAT